MYVYNVKKPLFRHFKIVEEFPRDAQRAQVYTNRYGTRRDLQVCRRGGPRYTKSLRQRLVAVRPSGFARSWHLARAVQTRPWFPVGLSCVDPIRIRRSWKAHDERVPSGVGPKLVFDYLLSVPIPEGIIRK